MLTIDFLNIHTLHIERGNLVIETYHLLLQRLKQKTSRPDGGIGRRAGLKHQWSNPSRFDPGSRYPLMASQISKLLKHKRLAIFQFKTPPHKNQLKSILKVNNNHEAAQSEVSPPPLIDGLPISTLVTTSSRIRGYDFIPIICLNI